MIILLLKGICGGAKYQVQIIEKIETKGRTKRRALDPSYVQKRKAEKTEGIKTLQQCIHMELMIKLVTKLQPIKAT